MREKAVFKRLADVIALYDRFVFSLSPRRRPLQSSVWDSIRELRRLKMLNTNVPNEAGDLCQSYRWNWDRSEQSNRKSEFLPDNSNGFHQVGVI